MFEFLGFGRTKQANSEDPKPRAAPEPSAGPAKHKMQREMVRLALSSVLGRNGIPPQWIGFELTPMARTDGVDATLIQLVIQKWHDGFLRYAPAIQAEVIAEIQLFGKNSSGTEFVITWKFAPDCGHPAGGLPDAAFWSTAPEPKTSAPDLKEPTSDETWAKTTPAAKFDLPPSSLDFGDTQSGFASTQIDDLREDSR